MTRRPGGRAARGMTLIEVMVAGVVLLVAMLGFVAASRYAVTANAMGHRRTTTAFLRGELLDRLTVTPRAGLAKLTTYNGAATTPTTFVVDTCYDVNGVALTRNGGWASSSFTCGADAVYRSWVSAASTGASTWSVGLYVERFDATGPGCSVSERNSKDACSSADLALTD
jgi:Tfp pilus assembly protein PilV